MHAYREHYTYETMLQLTPNQTVFEYDDSLDGPNIPYHPGYIRIDEIDLYQQFQYETIDVNHAIINNICERLFDVIHNGRYEWINHESYLNHNSIILTKIISRLKCVTNEYNDYDNFIVYLYQTTRTNVISQDRRYMDDEEYQLRLSEFIINVFINTISYNDTIKLFAKHYGDIVNYLFYRL